MFRLIVILLICGAFAYGGYRIGTFYGQAGANLEERAAARPEAPAAQAPGAQPEPAPQAAAPGEQRTAVRNVTPEGMFSGPISHYRPPPPATEPQAEADAEQTPAAKKEPKTQRYFRVMVEDASTLKAQGHTIRLAGIEAPADDATCTDESGARWPCGRAARGALALYLRGRAVDCATVSRSGEKTGDKTDDAITATCSLGGDDIGQWMVAQGWAKPAGGDRYREAAKAAQDGRLGLYQPEWHGGDTRPQPAAVPPVGSLTQD